MKNHADIKRMILFASIACLAVGCTGQGYVQSRSYSWMLSLLLSHDVPEISVDSLRQHEDSVHLLDARSKREFEVSHLAGARHVGYKNFDASTLKDLPKTTPIVVYCAVGYRSEKVTETLEKKGFKNVSNLYGGIFEWKNEGQPVVSAVGPTDSLHAYNHFWGIWLNKGVKVYD